MAIRSRNKAVRSSPLMIRLDDETREELRRFAFLKKTSMSEIGREAIVATIRAEVETSREFGEKLEKLRKLESVARHRSQTGGVSKSNARQMASKAARLDDSEGIGKVTVRWGSRGGGKQF